MTRKIIDQAGFAPHHNSTATVAGLHRPDIFHVKTKQCRPKFVGAQLLCTHHVC